MAEGYEQILHRMEERYRELSGADPAQSGDVGLRLKTLAWEAARLEERLEEMIQIAFPQTARGEWLDLHAAQRGLLRKAAVCARGEVLFSRTMGEERCVIPAGTAVAARRDVSLRYLTREEAVLESGELERLVPVESILPGVEGCAAAGEVSVLVSPVAGIRQVSNPKPILGGEEAEGDEGLRRRLLESYRSTTNGTNAAFYYNYALQKEGVASAKVIPCPRGSGTVDLVVSGPGVDSGLLAQLEGELGKIKELNVQLTVEAARERTVNLEVQVGVREGYSQQDALEQSREAILETAAQQQVGEPLRLARLVAAVLGCPGVDNCRVLAPQRDEYPLEREIIRCGEIQLSEMEVR